MQSAPEEELVVKANELVMSQIDLSKREYRIFLAHVSQITKDDHGAENLSIKLKKLCELSDVETQNIYSEIEDIADRLTKKRIHVEDGPSGKRVGGFFNLYSSCKYKEETGEIIGSFTSEMKPLLLELQSHFTMYLRQHAMSLRSMYAMRFYEILKRYDHQEEFSLSVGRLREIFRLEDKYPRFTDLRRRVIDKAKEELDEGSDVTFEYEVVRDGQKPQRIDFDIIDQEDTKLPEVTDPQSEWARHYDRLPKKEKKRIYREAEEKARRANPDAEGQHLKSQIWMHVKRILESR
jgi:plasmid replication initiation protein